MTVEEMEAKQEQLHNEFESAKSECYSKYMEMRRLSEEYNKIEEEIKKLKGEQ